jgi:hypothetical protein
VCHEEVWGLPSEDFGAGCGQVLHEVVRVDVMGVEGEVTAVRLGQHSLPGSLSELLLDDQEKEYENRKKRDILNNNMTSVQTSAAWYTFMKPLGKFRIFRFDLSLEIKSKDFIKLNNDLTKKFNEIIWKPAPKPLKYLIGPF